MGVFRTMASNVLKLPLRHLLVLHPFGGNTGNAVGGGGGGGGGGGAAAGPPRRAPPAPPPPPPPPPPYCVPPNGRRTHLLCH
jgi:hypothetical protein